MIPQAVIFDIGNVLIEWQPERFYDSEIGEDRRRAMFAQIDLHAMNDLVDQGHHFTRTIYDWADRHPEWRNEIRMWHDRWLDLATPEIPHSIRLLRALRRRSVPVFALTNFGIESFDYAAQHYPVLAEFDRRYISGHMKVTKPDPRIYQMVEEDCGLAPGALIFADDRLENLEAAHERGWQVHHFRGSQGWAARLVDLGLLTEDEAT
jgi:2-haloacid dehalogenase